GFAADDPAPVIELDVFYPGLDPGRWVIISGERLVPKSDLLNSTLGSTTGFGSQELVNTGVRVSELLMISSVSHEAKTLFGGQLIEVAEEKLHTFIRFAE